MPLGIKPMVDFAFKKIFGMETKTRALVGLLNAVLELTEPIIEVRVLNPFNYREFADDKEVVLDIRARDAAGRWMNVEMQLTVVAGLKRRLAYYACSLYTSQLQRGEDYESLQPAYTICLLCEVLFSDTSAAHHRFRLADTERDRVLADAFEVHTVELTKYNLDEASIVRASPVEKWAFFLLYADRYEADRLRELLPGNEFQEAISTAETIREKTEDRQMYDQREKAQRDYLWAIEGARKQAREEGREEGRQEGREEGRREGELVGKIELLCQLLGEPVENKADLESRSLEELRAMVVELQEQLRSRGGFGAEGS